MNNTLFAMHNIKYVISVDDCYFAPKRKEIQAKLYGEMCESIEPFREGLVSLGKSDKLAEIADLSELGTDTTGLISALLDSLTDPELSIFFSEKNGQEPASDERTGILAFLNGLKEKGCIEKYITLPSTHAAAEFDCKVEGMTEGNILWLLDRNFEHVGESAEAGIEFAQTIVQRATAQTNFVYILSAVDEDSDRSEDDIEIEFNTFLSRICTPDIASFVYYINKQRILLNQEKKIEKSLAQGFKRKVCFELVQIYGACLKSSVEAASEIILGINQKTLNYLFAQKVKDKGESRVDFLTRLVQIFQSDEYNRTLASKHRKIVNRISYYEALCNAVKDGISDVSELTPILKKLRETELYNKHVNSQHFEISTGDIFNINGRYYLLVSQSCDTYLREGGKRKLISACLLEIIDQTEALDYKHKLSCFANFKKPIVAYQSQIIIPFDVLDLCVANSDGKAQIDFANMSAGPACKLIGYTRNYTERYKIICSRLDTLYNCRNILEQYIDKTDDISSESARSAYRTLINEDAFLKRYDVENNVLYYPVQRISRLDELTTVEIVKDYGATLSRIGQPFDFSE